MTTLFDRILENEGLYVVPSDKYCFNVKVHKAICAKIDDLEELTIKQAKVLQIHSEIFDDLRLRINELETKLGDHGIFN